MNVVPLFAHTYGFRSLNAYPLINCLRVFPRASIPTRINNSKLQGSNDMSAWVDLCVVQGISAADWYEFAFSNPAAYRYVRLLMPGGSYGNIAEFEVYTDAVKRSGTPFGTPGSYQNDPNVTFYAAFDGRTDSYFDAADGSEQVVGYDFSTPT